MQELEVYVPNNLEVKWAIVRPKSITKDTKIKEIIVCSFYNPPKSKKVKCLLDHIIGTLFSLKARFPLAGYVIGGDKNEMDVSSLTDALPKCSQMVKTPTYKNKILDIIITNMEKMYDNPEILKEVLPDNPVTHKPSDHLVPVI